ncbi:MAG: ABC transporter substrate-binding protein, partial [Halofilum sp. (in: g-proteobacteria)]
MNAKTQPQSRGASRMLRKLPVVALGALLAMPMSAHAMRIAFGDIPSIESLNLLVAIERAKERGVDANLTHFDSEDVAAQAVVGQEADMGVGAPYALIQRVGTPIRMVYQLSTLQFFPVVNSERYQGWEDLDGETVAVHSRGSGTEALMRLMADKHGIEYANISYVPGSEVRAGGLLQGNIHASIVDSASWRLLQDEGGGQFQRLPVEDVNATDEALYASQEYVENNPEDVRILMEEMLRTWREINENPEVVADLRDEYDLLPDLPSQMEDELVPFYRDSAESGLFPNDGGDAEAVQADL